MSPRLTFALSAAHEVALGTLRHFQRGIRYELKADETPVTIADREAEAHIRRLIAAAYPGEQILGEEEGGATEGDRWVIDPIDGTKSFIAGVPLYATLLSYEQDGQPVLGVCVLPALGEVVYAEKGSGCFWNDSPCHASKQNDLSQSILCCGSHVTMSNAGRLDPFLKLAEGALASRGLTDSYGHALVATGRTEAMIDPVVSRWDISAISVIVREAGGSFTDFDGHDTLAEEAISCAPGITEQVIGAFKK